MTVITREEIDAAGATNAMELLNLVSANNSAGNVSIANVDRRADVLRADRIAARPGRAAAPWCC